MTFTTIIVLLLTCVLSHQGLGTELVITVEKNRVVLAADGIVVDNHGKQYARCKIHQAGDSNFFYAVTGLVFDSEIGFDAEKLLPRHTAIDTAKYLDNLDDLFLPPLRKELELIRKESPIHYDEFAQGAAIVSLFVVDLHAGVREAYTKEFKLSGGHVTAIHAKRCVEGHIFQEGERCTLMSSQSKLIPFLAKNPVLKTDDIITSIHKIMDAAQKARPTEVGPPISILDIEGWGPQWLEREGCEDIRRPTPKKNTTRVKR